MTGGGPSGGDATKRRRLTSAVSLETKVAPSQGRARATFENILEVTALLLGEVGVERLSTNLICERAGLTPPALYRYFPNKYAILRELGKRLMDAEDVVFYETIKRGGLRIAGTLDQAVQRRVTFDARLRQALSAQPGAIWILRAMRAVPVLREVRETSVREVAEAAFLGLQKAWPHADPARLRAAAIVSTAAVTSVNEAILEQPEDEDALGYELGYMIALYLRHVVGLTDPDGPICDDD